MDKIKRVLEHQEFQRNQEIQARQYREQQLHQLCDLVEGWVAPLSALKWHRNGPDRLLHLTLLQEDTLVLRFAPQWHKNPYHVHIAISIFDTTQPRQRALFLLAWCSKKQQWRILSLRRKNHRFPLLLYRRTFRKVLFETCLIDFLHTAD